MTLLRAPIESGEATVGGVAYAVANGLVDIPEAQIGALVESHGYAVAEDEENPNFVPVDDIETMKRGELFAVLKAKGIAAVPPITNDELRALIRGASQPAA